MSVKALYMKYRLFNSVLCAGFAVLVGLWGCKKQTGGTTKASVTSNVAYDTLLNMKFNVNGLDCSSDSVKSYRIANLRDSGKYSIQITASRTIDSTTRTIKLELDDYIGVGMYNINPPTNAATYYINSSRKFGTEGLVLVTVDSPAFIQGEFYFVSDTFHITNGTFRVGKP